MPALADEEAAAVDNGDGPSAVENEDDDDGDMPVNVATGQLDTSGYSEDGTPG